MSEPVAEKIMSILRDRMAAFATAYRSTRVATWQPKDLTVHCYQGEIQPNELASCPGNPPAQGYDMQAIVAGIVKPSDLDTTPIDRFKNRMWSDIVKAATDAELWHQWGGNAINTVIGPVQEYTDDSGAVAGVMVTFTVTFRTDENNPYTARA
jgi:hypothetical protein